MSQVATSQVVTRDQLAADAVVAHHAQLADALDAHVAAVVDGAERHDVRDVWRARADLLAWLRTELLPHARAEEEALYPAAAARVEGKLLVNGMLAEHQMISALVEELAAAGTPVRAAASARALRALFVAHLAKENELVVPLLVAARDTSLADLLAGMHELLGSPDEAADTAGCGCGGCGCAGDAAA